ncbi:hemolysin III family protein [Proteiniclasticum sp. QWL-01]|uniref:PAQR family membrane homeostasis protein TrhA n=1 Tax=Proteiniclasticum sp. QWL-01 TaxID=3036945 RepID=UPI00240FBA75|nr:hemolysin III family protein [Proteiniclasticum sp. QWL-01]WFF72080.1 hemolysin III family protein [Proteiniclasticum sp. QWL-01]
MLNKYIREPVNSLTHLGGAALAVIGLILLIRKGITAGISTGQMVSLVAFGVSMIALYATSGIYHLIQMGKKAILFMKKLDHSMIFVLIAGTYTPIIAFILDGTFRWAMLVLIWGIAVLGVFFKVFWIEAPRWLYTGIYLGMGWLSVILLRTILIGAGLPGLLLLLGGGLSYTAGAVIYGLKKPNISKMFGFHELFHCFVLLGTFLHYLMIYTRLIG